MIYSHEFVVKTPIAAVAAFHRSALSLGAITPPPLSVRVHSAPENLNSGDEMDFSIGWGPLRLRWLARIEDASDLGFTDRLLVGVFQSWVHRHSFVALDGQTTLVRDQVTATLKKSVAGVLLGGAMWLGLPFLFAYRGWRTRQLLEQHS